MTTAPLTTTRTPSLTGALRTVPGAGPDPLEEALALTRRLKLPHIRRVLGDVVPTAKAQRWDPAEVVRVLLAEEAAGRDRANLHTRRKRAAFPTGKTFGDWDETKSSIPRPTQDALKALEWIGRRENLSICGPSGTGKSHFSEAIGQAAIEAGMTVAWFTIEDLGVLVRRHRADDSIARALTRIIRSDLIIVDDIGLLPVSPDAAEGFYRLVDAAYERRSIAVSSNLHPSGFDEIMPKTLATATVDRLLHHAHIVVTDGDSYRLAQATNGQGVKPFS
jgi:DNA replication protein DnaC